jgi:hypothetical protein
LTVGGCSARIVIYTLPLDVATTNSIGPTFDTTERLTIETGYLIAITALLILKSQSLPESFSV